MKERRTIPLILIGGGALVLILGGILLHHAMGGVNHVALSSAPKPVTVVAARPTTFRANRRYVGAVEPWVSATVGPQLVSAYTETVLVRPGDKVKHGQVLATLDCRNTDALAKRTRMQARAVSDMQSAIAAEAARVTTLLDGGFVSPNEVEQKNAESTSKQAQLYALQAQLSAQQVEQQDCIMRAPFDGEIGERLVDPGVFVRPGTVVVTVVDRSTLRIATDVPEGDFDAVAPGNPVNIRVLATGALLQARISRRAPQADEGTRTVHMEIDVPNRDRKIPSGSTADLNIDVGQPLPALAVPLMAATVHGDSATVVVVENGKARLKTVSLVGEREGMLYLDRKLGDNALVVTEGRDSVVEGDAVNAHRGDETPLPHEGGAATVSAEGR